MGKIKETLFWITLTNKCRYCGALLECGEKLCKDCENNLPRIEDPRCQYCGAGKKRCQCEKHRMRFDGITAPFYYEEGVLKGLQRLKFGEKSFMAEVFVEDMQRAVKKDFGEIKFDFITFVPFSSFQERNRQYNQSELLAEALGKKLSIPVEKVMVKLFDTGVQHKMSQYRRKGNVLGVYDVEPNIDVDGKTILLVDDIKTTGATFNECAKMLKIRGAEKVYCISVAMTGKKEDNENEEDD